MPNPKSNIPLPLALAPAPASASDPNIEPETESPHRAPPHVRLTEAADRLERLLLASIDAMESTPDPPTLAEINTASQALWRLTAVRKTLQNLASAAAASSSVPPEGPRGITEEEIQELLDRCSGHEENDDYEEQDDPEPDPAKNQTLARATAPPTLPSPSPSLSVKPISVPECPTIPALISPTLKRIATYADRTAKLLLNPTPLQSSRSRDPVERKFSLQPPPNPPQSAPKPSPAPLQPAMIPSPP